MPTSSATAAPVVTEGVATAPDAPNAVTPPGLPDAATTSVTPPVNTLKRPRAVQPVTHFLSPASANTPSFASTASTAPPTSTLADHGDENGADEVPVPPKQVRIEGPNGSPPTPRSPYAGLPRKIPRKTPVSTPASSLGTPTLVSPVQLSSSLTTPTPSPATSVSAAAAKLAALRQRWANLLRGALMKERQPHETEAVMALAMRIVEALPGDLEETKDGFQTLLFSLKDEKNGELRRMVVEGELLVEKLVQMDDRELANPEVRKKIEEKMEDRAKDTNMSELAKAMRTSNSTLFKCMTCGARDTSWYQRQTRSGDEPMTVIITCNRCNTQWRKY
ncbi:putative transcription elongation factor [Leptomonas pyrrhocoris]|uniref:Putative transcription elongation factor n=1 Tax=Leptomonas pyrrhocoris TaxID=157538 RepID=A0A0M9FZC6_LEPPY|nr:putative transcription elongation factor [Leptomonas pyrrhocoris]XP_015657456.1 putative transcription elongation factor [Leptomonas pyrrhocoris]KPA79016.1 putative transcription elongation factor [Leptomonas pyrrhocoris]KPA79017.1 putative transcription elongation factor [Leptomonas pyrrhocoris]|eukprot:XP_015657455.1 putative transcription elongation factor [Leptomonas pyrrhocoris]